MYSGKFRTFLQRTPESIFTTLVTKDPTGRLLKDIEDLEDAIVADSEQRIDSEPALQASM